MIIMAELCVCFCLLAQLASAELAPTDKWGRLQSILLREEYVPIRTDFRLPTLGWKQLPGLSHAQNLNYSETPDGRIWWGTIEIEKGKRCRYLQKLTEIHGTVTIDLAVTAEQDLSIEGVYFWFDVPIALFANGQCELSAPFQPQTITELPAKQPASRHLTTGYAREFTFRDAKRASQLKVRFDRTSFATVQDNRIFNAQTYSVIVEALKGTLEKGKSVSIRATIIPDGKADRRPVQLGPGHKPQALSLRRIWRQLLFQNRISCYGVHTQEPEDGLGSHKNDTHGLGAPK